MNVNFEKLINMVHTDWKNVLKNIYDNLDDESNISNINKILKNLHVYPPIPIIFNAFNHFNIKDTKVVILGQDPYHQKSQAMGLAFSIFSDCKIPPSLRNIIKEINNEYSNPEINNHDGNLMYLVDQGVLLLNSSLTVFDSKPGIHMKYWEEFTDKIIEHISRNNENVVFMLWGNFSRSKKEFIDTSKHCILETTHPSPLSASKGFLGSNHFKQCNEYFKSKEIDIITW
jgi:uracil-DNA glycosylase